MKDEYISVEHIMLSIIDNANSYLKNLFKKYRLTKKRIFKSIRKCKRKY